MPMVGDVFEDEKTESLIWTWGWTASCLWLIDHLSDDAGREQRHGRWEAYGSWPIPSDAERIDKNLLPKSHFLLVTTSKPRELSFFCHGQTNKISSKTNRLDIKIRCTSNKQQSPKRSSLIPLFTLQVHMSMPSSPPIRYQNKMYSINYSLK